MTPISSFGKLKEKSTMFDMHIHIIPDIDDGSKDMETSKAMLRIAAENGTTHIIATPHVIEGDWLPSWEIINEGCKNLRQWASELGLNLQIYPGGEIAMNMDILEQIKGPGQYCINGGRYLLVELPAAEIPDYADDFFFTLQARGITPILAHPERHPVIARNPQRLADWINKGILTQLNCTSLIGKMGERTMKTAELLVANNMIYLVGSDAHGIRTRNPNLRQGIAKLKAMVGEEKTLQISYGHPHAILSNRDIIIQEIAAIKLKKESNIFRRLRALFN